MNRTACITFNKSVRYIHKSTTSVRLRLRAPPWQSKSFELSPHFPPNSTLIPSELLLIGIKQQNQLSEWDKWNSHGNSRWFGVRIHDCVAIRAQSERICCNFHWLANCWCKFSVQSSITCRFEKIGWIFTFNSKLKSHAMFWRGCPLNP